MKNLVMTLLVLLAVIALSHCGTPVTPPGPGPSPVPPIPGPTPVPPPVPIPVPIPPVETVFEVNGEKIVVKGVMKPNAKATISEMRAAVKSAVYNLEN